MYIDYTDIGLLMEKAGYLPSYENIPVEQYRNSNPISDKEYLLNLIVNDKEVHKNVHKYLSADIELYQELPITKIIAWHRSLLVYNTCMFSVNAKLK